MSGLAHQLAPARFEDVEFLCSHPEVLAEAEAIFGVAASAEPEVEPEPDWLADWPPGRKIETGGVEGASPPLHLSGTDNWLAPSREDRQSSLLPRAVIPRLPEPANPEEIARFERESVEQPTQQPLPSGWIHCLPKPELGENGEVVRLGDGTGPNQEQALALWFFGVEKKAQRLACCGRFGRVLECMCCNPRRKFGQRFRCGLRYCPGCGPANFQALFVKYLPLQALAEPRRGRVVAILDFTLKNTGVIPDPETIRRMNRAIRKVMRRLLRKWKRKDWGYIWCLEFGVDNENLHAHGLYVGPYIPQGEIAEAWLAETGDSKIVFIQKAENFRRGLIHALKYTSKMPSEDPKRLAQLEAAFDGVRRVHSLAIFYDSELTQEKDSEDSAANPECPYGGGLLEIVSGYCPIGELEAAGLREVGEVRRELSRHAALMLGQPP